MIDDHICTRDVVQKTTHVNFSIMAVLLKVVVIIFQACSLDSFNNLHCIHGHGQLVCVN